MDGRLRIVFIGDVDCGKSTLIGRFLFDTDSISFQAKEELKKISQESRRDLEFAYLLDSFQEEREDEFTLDTTQALLKTKDEEFLLIDVPGHRALLRNMLTGASYADTAVLVVDVKKSLEEQTRRHLYILKFLGIQQLIVCINKMDLVSYQEEYFIKARGQIEECLKEIGLYSSCIIPVSAKEGENLLKEPLKMNWYKGPFVIKALNTLTRKDRICDFRLPIQDIYEIKKEKIVVGAIVSGKINKGDLVRVSPLEMELKVKTIKRFGKGMQTAESRENIGLVFYRLPRELKRGQVFYKGMTPRVSNQIQVKIFCLDSVDIQEELIIKCATQQVRGRISEIRQRVDTTTLEIIGDINALKSLDAAEVIITTEEPLVVAEFQDLASLGRFVIEKDNKVCAIGIIC